MNKTVTALRNAAALILLAAAVIFAMSGKQDMKRDDASKPSEDTLEGVSESVETEKSEREMFLSSLKAGGECVDDTYDPSSMYISRADIARLGITRELSRSNKSVSVPVRVPDEVFGTYTTVFETRELARIQLELYDGKLIVDRGDKLELYSPDGKMLSDSLTLSPAYLRDAEGNAMYKDENGELFIFTESGVVPAVAQDKSALIRLIEYENTADFAFEDNGYHMIRESESDDALAALANAEGERLTDYEYVRIYAFSQGLAAALLPDGSINYLDREGNVVIEGRQSYKSTSDRYVDRVYTLFDTMDESSLGALYFDGSVVLVREKTVDYVYKENTISDKTRAIDMSGNELSVISDYNILSSSDGVIVVERDGRYGAFSSSERWVLQPIYEDIAPYYEGLAVVKKDGRFGVCDTSGNIVVPFVFDYISPVSSGRAVAYSFEGGFELLEKRIAL